MRSDPLQKILDIRFFCTNSGVEPVRDWIRDFRKEDKRAIGEDIKTVQFGWPLGMPLLRNLGTGLWEIRSHLSNGRTARIIFFIENKTMILVHGFIKKTQKTPASEIDLAKKRQRQFKREE